MLMSAQATSPEVTASSGAYFSNATGSISWTLSEPVTETYTNGGNTLTQGFQQPLESGITLDLTVFLEGPFDVTDMKTDLNLILPLGQPYYTAPWNYTGTESVASIPNSNVVDWVLVELRETTGDASTASSDSIIAQKAAFILNDGSVVGLDGINAIFCFTNTIL